MRSFLCVDCLTFFEQNMGYISGEENLFLEHLQGGPPSGRGIQFVDIISKVQLQYYEVYSKSELLFQIPTKGLSSTNGSPYRQASYEKAQLQKAPYLHFRSSWKVLCATDRQGSRGRLEMVDGGRGRVRSHFVRPLVWHTLSVLRNVRKINC